MFLMSSSYHLVFVLSWCYFPSIIVLSYSTVFSLWTLPNLQDGSFGVGCLELASDKFVYVRFPYPEPGHPPQLEAKGWTLTPDCGSYFFSRASHSLGHLHPSRPGVVDASDFARPASLLKWPATSPATRSRYAHLPNHDNPQAPPKLLPAWQVNIWGFEAGIYLIWSMWVLYRRIRIEFDEHEGFLENILGGGNLVVINQGLMYFYPGNTWEPWEVWLPLNYVGLLSVGSYLFGWLDWNRSFDNLIDNATNRGTLIPSRGSGWFLVGRFSSFSWLF